ncbi:acetolactate decarboxylase [Paractinoplanes deccanensis]|uniref:Alpha-acetolactate decarboxylase n=1 Tax=Paractinoplanes deccanensis TaxID=113561 RepID=A0ABQ3XVB1_9ACTN|nr:acetolactate decarboxylase [Actinoplanes deccanensis]GID71602.1 acetolactate decarboxylase [Actinoplanes deccanensis]
MTFLDDVNDHRSREIFQSSTVGALLAGLDDGDLTIAELLRHGTFGLGTFDALDGEMVVLDGVCYQLHPDGTVTVAAGDRTTPFAAVTDLHADITIDLPAGHTDRAALIRLLESRLPGDNYFYAVRVDGVAASVTTRTVRKQAKPYPSLLQAAQGEQRRSFTDLPGTLVGFRSPDYAGTVTVPGYHLHFIDDQRRRGGHVLDFAFSAGTVTVGIVRNLRLRLPSAPAFARAELTGDQAGSAIAAAEGGSSPATT